jgi:hypothetical protein
VETTLKNMRGGGQPLEKSVREFFEPRFGHDFSHVRVHHDTRAAESSHAMNAQAYTLGRDIAFGTGQYGPGTTEGRRLIAHELSHVIQQSKGPSELGIQRKIGFDECDRRGGTSEKDAILAAHKKAIERIATAIDQLLNNPNNAVFPFRGAFKPQGLHAPRYDVKKEKKMIDQAINIYRMALAGLKAENFNYECDYKEDWNFKCEEGDLAWAMTGALSPLYDIHICWGFFDLNTVKDQADTIIHEALHKWGGISHGPDPLNNAYAYESFIDRLEGQGLLNVQPQPLEGNKGKREESASPGITFDLEFDFEMILGPKPKEECIAFDQDSLLELYQYLKYIRKYAPELEQLAKCILEIYFPDYGEEIWEMSKKPFAGYVGTRYLSKERMEAAQRLGLEKTGEKGWVKKFLGSDIIFFSGHHYGSGMLDYLDITDLKIRKRPAKFERVKLIMISSCNVLNKSNLPIWRRRFPNAYILGWYGSAPYRQSNMMMNFLSKLPEDLILDDQSDMEKVLKLWEAFIENLEDEDVKLLTSEKRKASKWGLGYATPDDTIKFMGKNRKGDWVWITQRRGE